jgi:hypothetical protein
MANGPLSPVMLIASSGLLQNQGLEISGNLTIAITDYGNTTVVSTFQSVLDAAVTANLTSNVIAGLQTLSANSIPALTNVIPTDYLGNLLNIASYSNVANYAVGDTVVYESAVWECIDDITGNAPPTANYWAPDSDATRFTSLIVPQAQGIFGADISKFIQIYNQAQGYQSTVNQFINSSNNTQGLDATFIDMDALTTGGISLLSNDTEILGDDLTKLGQLINPAEVMLQGYPSALVRQVFNVGGLLPALRSALSLVGLTTAQLSDIVKSNVALAGTVEKSIYTALTTVKNDDLTQVLFLLDVTTRNLSTMADLLNPVKIFPDSYQSLTTRTSTGTELIYLPSGAVNSNLETAFATDAAYQELKKIIPPDQALANRAWVRSLLQVKNIYTIILPDLAIAVSATETNSGLGDINALTQTVPDSVKITLNNELVPNITLGNLTIPSGTGDNGTLLLSDFIGTPAGIPYVAQLGTASITINLMQTRGWLSSLTDNTTGLFVQMNKTLAGDYGNAPVVIPGGPAAGSYANVDVAFETGLIPNAVSAIANISSMYPGDSNTLVETFTLMSNQLIREPMNLALADVDANTLPANNKTAIMSFATSLHSIGEDATVGGPNDIISSMANASSQSGQAIIASLREGRNITALGDVGISTDTQLNDR